MGQYVPPSSPEDQGPVLRNMTIAFIILETCFVSLRYVSRAMIRAPSGIDDYLMPLGWLFNMALCGVALAMVSEGRVGHHVGWIAENDPGALTTYLKLGIPFIVMWAMAVMAPKLAILGLFLRIFTKRWHRVSCFVLIGIVSASAFVVVIATALQCVPIAAVWDPDGHPNAHCIDTNAFWRWGSFPNIITDVMMLFLPMPCIWKLQLSTRDKIGVILTFTTGSVGTITSIIRFATFFQTDGQTDMTWTAMKLGCCSVAEPGVYLMAACLPTYRSLLRYAFRSLGISIGSSAGSRFETTNRDDTLRTIGDRSTNLTAVHTKNGRRVFISDIEDSLNELGPLSTENDERVLVNSMVNQMKQDQQDAKFESSDEVDATSSQDSGCAIQSQSQSQSQSRDSTCSTPPLGAIRIERDYKVVSSRR